MKNPSKSERREKVFVAKSSMPELDEFMEVVKPIFDSNIMTNMGPIYRELKAGLRDYLEVKEISLFANGHLALEMTLQALNLEGEVITTPYTFASTTHAITRNGLTPVFCDIKEGDFTIDVEKIEELITEKTCAILPVHVYGYICDVEKIERIAKKHNLKVIYDAAHAFGCKYKGTAVGNFGDASMFSFHATKVFNTIEGGGVSYNDAELYSSLHSLKNFGIHGEDRILSIGGNAKMDEFRAAMGICNLRYIDREIAKRKKVFEIYNGRLKNVAGIRIMNAQEDVQPNYAYYPIIIEPEEFGVGRDEVYEALRCEDIYARKYFYPITNEFECYQKLYGTGHTPIAKDISLKVLTLPLYAELSEKNINRICDIIIEVALKN